MTTPPSPRLPTGLAVAATIAFAALLFPWGPVRAQEATAGVPNATQTANINAALAQLRADIAEATRVNAEVTSRRKREENAREIAVYQRVLDNLTGKLSRGELHPVDGLNPGTLAGTNNIVRFVYEDDNARTYGMDSTPTGAYCPENAYILVGTQADLAAYQEIRGANAAAARAARTQFVASGRVRRIACPRGHMVFDSGLLDPGSGTAIDVTTNDGWCRARELLDVLAHEKFHEIVIEDEVAVLRRRPDFINSNPADRARREAAVFRQGASHGNHRLVYGWQIKVDQLALALVERRLKEIRDGTGAAAAAGEADALNAKKECLERRIADLGRYGRRATGGTHFHSAVVREHEECVGTTYHVSETVIEEGGTVVNLESQVAVEDRTAEEADGGIPECREGGGSAITYIPVPPGEDRPAPEDGGKQPPSTTVARDEPKPAQTPEEEDLDLGLVKAVTSVVTIALSREDSGEPIAGATVKLVDEAPDLPATGLRDPASMAEYLTDQTASETGADGALRIEVSPEIEVSLVADDETGETGSTVLDAGDADANADGEIRVHHRITAKAPMAQAVTAMARSATTAAGRMPYPAGLGAQWREKICVRRSFIIGDTALYVLTMPEEAVEPFERIVSQTESVLFVEDDPCREKESPADGARNSKAFLDLTFSPGWSE